MQGKAIAGKLVYGLLPLDSLIYSKASYIDTWYHMLEPKVRRRKSDAYATLQILSLAGRGTG
jgi:hypothetical protein